jgi:hypothetical protein
MLVTWLARPAALATLGTGLMLALSTRWGLLRHWWPPAKLVLLVATVALTVTVSPDALRYAVDHAESAGTAAYTDVQHTLVLMAAYHVVSTPTAPVCSWPCSSRSRPQWPVATGSLRTPWPQ